MKLRPWHRLVDDQPHGPFWRMRAQEHHAFGKGRIRHAGHGNQQFAFERSVIVHQCFSVCYRGTTG